MVPTYSKGPIHLVPPLNDIRLHPNLVDILVQDYDLRRVLQDARLARDGPPWWAWQRG